MAFEQYQNLSQTTLNGGIDNSTTTVVVTTGSVLPTANFRILVGSEIMYVSSRSTNTLTVIRGQEGSSAASHSDLDPVYHSLTGGAILQAIQDMTNTGAAASVPSPARRGALWLSNDSSLSFRDNSSALRGITGLWKFTPPVLGDFTWTNQGSATTSTTGNVITVNIPADASTGVSLRVLYKAKTPPYKITGFFQFGQIGQSYQSCGMGFYDGTGGKLVSMHFIVFDTDYSYVEVCNWTNTSTFSSAPGYAFLGSSGTAIGWMQIEHDGTNLIFRISNDGYTWIPVISLGKTAFMANDPNRVFFYGRNNTGSREPHSFTLLNWKEE